MKRIFALLTSIVLAANMLAAPCFAAEPEDPPAPLPGVSEPEQPENPEPPKKPDHPDIQPCDSLPGSGEVD